MPSPSQDPAANSAAQPERIDIDDARALDEWSGKLDVTADQLREAVQAVGSVAADVEMHLKGSRSTTNADRVEDADGPVLRPELQPSRRRSARCSW
ncbi:MAG: DUF3606 domain-containing protein [Variovorax sp.]